MKQQSQQEKILALNGLKLDDKEHFLCLLLFLEDYDG